MSNHEIEVQIRKLSEALKLKEQELETTRAAATGGWITTCQWPLPTGRGVSTNIQTCDQYMLVRLMADVLMQFDALDAAATELGWTHHISQVEGFKREQWKQDLHKRAAMITLRGREQKVAEMRQRIAGVTSEEERRRLEVEALTADMDRL